MRSTQHRGVRSRSGEARPLLFTRKGHDRRDSELVSRRPPASPNDASDEIPPLYSHTIVAVATYRGSGKSVYLHGENHLRQIAGSFDTPAQALAFFERLHGDTMRPGPAPMTDTEHQAAEARASPGTPTAEAEPPAAEVEIVPAYAADPGDHDAILDAFLTAHGDWERWRTWSDDTTHAIHESQTLRIERVHEAHPREIAWTVAAYETPVSDRLWHLTATGSTPAPVLQTLLDLLADDQGWDIPLGSPADEKNVTAATKPLAEAGWRHIVDGRWIRWTNPSNDAGVQFDAFAAQRPDSPLATWTIWAGPSIDRPAWTLHASPSTPALVINDLAEALVHSTSNHQRAAARHTVRRTTTPPHIPTAPAQSTGLSL